MNISSSDLNPLIFTQIFAVFNKLKYLRFGPSSSTYSTFSFVMLPPTVISPSLLELHINVEYFTDCLYLLDGRFNQLHTLDIKISTIRSSRRTINNTVESI